MPPIMASEDFGIFSLDEKIPAVIFWLGAYDPAKLAESRQTGVGLPSLHSPFSLLCLSLLSGPV
jgi:hypothetical protein